MKIGWIKGLAAGFALAVWLASPVWAGAEDELIAAAKAGETAEVERLLAQDADKEAKDWAGWTPLVWAALLLKNDVVQVLLTAGADIEAVGPGGKNSGTPLMMAAKKHGGIPTMRLLLDHGALIDGTDQYGRTALMIAAKHGRTENVAFLLSQGADPTIRNNLQMGGTALELAASAGHAEVVLLLEGAGAMDR